MSSLVGVRSYYLREQPCGAFRLMAEVEWECGDVTTEDVLEEDLTFEEARAEWFEREDGEPEVRGE